MSKNSGFSGVLDPSLVVQKMQALPYRGYPTSPGYQRALDEPLLTIYEKGGRQYAVTHVIDNEQPNLEISHKLASRTIPNMSGAYPVAKVTLRQFMNVWDHKNDAALSERVEAYDEINKIVPALMGAPTGADLRGPKLRME